MLGIMSAYLVEHSKENTNGTGETNCKTYEKEAGSKLCSRVDREDLAEKATFSSN